MKLHNSPGSRASAREQHGEACRALDPKSKARALELDDDAVLSEYQAIATYLARMHPDKRRIPEAPLEQARLDEALDHIVTPAGASAHYERMRARPRVQKALADEGLAA